MQRLDKLKDDFNQCCYVTVHFMRLRDQIIDLPKATQESYRIINIISLNEKQTAIFFKIEKIAEEKKIIDLKR